MGSEQQRPHPGEHRDVARLGARLRQPRRTTSTSAPAPSVGRMEADSKRGRVDLGIRRRPDLLVDATDVVGEQRAGGVDDRRRAAVVDLERVLLRAGEVLAVVDEEPRVGARVTVDDLIVVADAEHVVAGCREQPQEQHVRGCQVLQLVDQQVAVLGLPVAAERSVAEQQLDGQVDLLVVVDHLSATQLRPVRIERRRQTFGARRARPPPRPDRAGRGG